MKSEHVHLRALEPEDIIYLYRWENDPMVWKVSNTITPYSRYILKRYIENSHLDIFETKQVRFMIVHSETNIPIGTIDLFDFDPHNSRIGLGILIYDENNRGKGFASEALELTLKYCFEVLGVHQVFSNITCDNLDSLKMFEKKGFRNIGVKRDWMREKKGYKDEIMMQLIYNGNSGKVFS